MVQATSTHPETKPFPKKKFPLFVRIGLFALVLGVCTLIALVTLSSIGYQPSQRALNTIRNNPLTIQDRPEYISFLGKPQEKKRLLVFYPGATVAPRAYTAFLQSLTNDFRYIVLVKMPANLAVLDTKKGDEVIKLFQKDFAYSDETMKSLQITLAGHSMGGAMLSEYYTQSEYKNQVTSVIFFAAYPASDSLKKADLPALSLTGEYDGLIRSSEQDKAFEGWEKLQKVKVDVMNHAQWGDYGEMLGDKKSFDSHEVVQAKAVQNIKSWLQNLR